MEKESLPDRNILKNIVVQVGESDGKMETRRVTDKTESNVHVIRRPGEGSRPLFARDEIINGRRMYGDIEQDRRFASDRSHSNLGDRLRTDFDSYRRDYHAGVREIASCERSRDDLFFTSRRGRCPMCHSVPDYFAEICPERSQRPIYRTMSNEGLIRGHSNGYHNGLPGEMETYYLYEDPRYYAVLESVSSHPLYDYTYYSH